MPVFFAGSWLSAVYKLSESAAIIYLPPALGIILINWWGPKRVLPAVYLNAILAGFFWGIGPWYMRPVYALPETLFVLLSWYLFTFRSHGKCWLPDARNLTLFLFWGVVVPLFASMLFLKLLIFWQMGRPIDMVSSNAILGWLREFISNFGLTLPVLYFLTPAMSRHGLLTMHIDTADVRRPFSITRSFLVGGLCLIAIVFSMFVPPEKYWFVYGILSLWFAINYGFGLAILTNSLFLLATYFGSVLDQTGEAGLYAVAPQLVNVYLGTGLLYVFSAITGRVIDDINFARQQITSQVINLERANNELKVANKELDHFVYSVSHDLTAPLKSIKGLVNLSHLTDDLDSHRTYFGKIGDSVAKLEQFIREVLDFSHIKRIEANYQRISLKELVTGILDDLRYAEGFEQVHIDHSGMLVDEIINDKISIKVVLANLIGNAIAYRKTTPGFPCEIKIRSRRRGGEVVIEVEDNGIGIRPELIKRIFEMFFRGTTNSRGSGLGLYIASEAAARIGGSLSVESEFNKGSVFTLRVKIISK